jgi:hypothetical protein
MELGAWSLELGAWSLELQSGLMIIVSSEPIGKVISKAQLRCKVIK